MTDKVLVVTAPDDVVLDGIRILAVNLTQEHGQIVSNALLQFENSSVTVINYVWNNGDNTTWLLDKKFKSNLILFNADDTNSAIVGFMAAQPKSHYFGTLRDLNLANDRVLFSSAEIVLLLQKILKSYQ